MVRVDQLQIDFRESKPLKGPEAGAEEIQLTIGRPRF
jgi:hypothetical protein